MAIDVDAIVHCFNAVLADNHHSNTRVLEEVDQLADDTINRAHF
jgi:hypothetical protein